MHKTPPSPFPLRGIRGKGEGGLGDSRRNKN